MPLPGPVCDEGTHLRLRDFAVVPLMPTRVVAMSFTATGHVVFCVVFGDVTYLDESNYLVFKQLRRDPANVNA